MSVYTVIDSGKVSNIIVADQDFADAITADHEAVVLQAGNAGIGDSYSNGLFISQPQSLSLSEASSAQFVVSGNAAEGSLTYQWKKDGSNITDATSNTLTIESVVSGDAGSYTCLMSDGTNSLESDAAILTVL